MSTAATNRTKLDEELLVWNTNMETFQAIQNVEIDQEEEETENYCTSKWSFALFFQEVFALAEKTEELKLEKPDLCDFITAQTADRKCCMAPATVEQTGTSISYEADEYWWEFH